MVHDQFRPTSRQKYSREELLDFLRKFHKENERLPTNDELDELSRKREGPCSRTYFNRFGGILHAGKIAGLGCEDAGNRIDTKNDLLRVMKKFAEDFLKENDRYPSAQEANRKFSRAMNRFQITWKNFCITNGYKPIRFGKQANQFPGPYK